jgi:hypothetical protein
MNVIKENGGDTEERLARAMAILRDVDRRLTPEVRAQLAVAAEELDEELLFIGNDFTHTDVRCT